MNRQNKLLIFGILILLFLTRAGFYLHGQNIAVLNPKGPIAAQEKHLMIVAVLLMLIVVIPVFVLTFSIAWHFRASNTKAKYTPDWDRNKGYETIWWTVPLLLIVALSTITWRSSHTLDPSRPINSTVPPVVVQAVALQWKWLFIYPEQHIASVNYLQFPKNTPVNFQITSDSTMNSFWIPQLGGQIYAMAGMSTQLHLLASSEGSFRGDSANISGKGFAGMNFVAKATSQQDFDKWVTATQNSSNQLGMAAYTALAEPSSYTHPEAYSLQAQGLYDTIIGKFAGPGTAMYSMNMSRLADENINGSIAE
jgi:cytochrome o ubiquinol oxidase subunit 2